MNTQRRKNLKMNSEAFAAKLQPGGRLMPGYGQAGYRTMSSLGAVPLAPLGLWALPPHFRRHK